MIRKIINKLMYIHDVFEFYFNRSISFRINRIAIKAKKEYGLNFAYKMIFYYLFKKMHEEGKPDTYISYIVKSAWEMRPKERKVSNKNNIIPINKYLTKKG